MEQKDRKGDTVRINEESRVIIHRIHEITNIPKGMILFDSLRMLEEKLKKEDYNYSKIIQIFPERK